MKKEILYLYALMTILAIIHRWSDLIQKGKFQQPADKPYGSNLFCKALEKDDLSSSSITVEGNLSSPFINYVKGKDFCPNAINIGSNIIRTDGATLKILGVFAGKSTT